MGKARWFLEGSSHYATMLIGKKWGHHFPMHFVCSFPRSGSTWLSEMIADYLNLPRPSHYIFPVGFSSVIHTHVRPNFGLNDCFYIYRDGRDCYLSFYYYLLKKLEEDGESFNEYRFWTKKFGKDKHQERIRENFCIYLEEQFKKKQNWNNHVSGWLAKANFENNITAIQFEQLKKDPYNMLRRACLEKFENVSDELLKEAIQRQSFKSQKKRNKDQHRTYIRRGATGDWKSLFCVESAQIFDHYAGETLVQLGYEKNSKWIYNYSEETKSNESSTPVRF